MTESRLSRLQRFIYSHHFVSGARRGSGVILAFVVASALLGNPNAGMIAALGALCVGIIDQPGPLSQRIREMTGGLFLGVLAVSLTGFASSHPFLLLISVVGQTFAFSMFAVFGKRGAIIGLGCLIVTVTTMHTPLTPDEVLEHTLITLGGGLFYLLFSSLASLPLSVREEEQALSVALFATANYVYARGEMYDPGTDIDEAYRKLLASQAVMSDQHQSARDMIMRRLSKEALVESPRKIMIWNIYIDMVNMLEMLVATHTDYTLLHRKLGESDTIIFMRDALLKMSSELERIAQAVTREKRVHRRNSVKAELRALEYELEQMKRSGFQKEEAQTYAICVQVLRRLRNSNRLIEHMLAQTSMPRDEKPLNIDQLETSLVEFLSRQSFRPGLLTSNLRKDSPTFRFSLRVSLGVAIALMLGIVFPQLGPHGYWIVLTVIIIMKPAFALTKQRNTARLTGTLLGCVIAFVVFFLTDDTRTLILIMVASIIIGFSFTIINYLVASVFMTVTLLIALHFLLPSSYDLVAERALDTVLGSIIAFACSYFLPWWEANSLPSLARAAIRANQEYLRSAIRLLELPGDDPGRDRYQQYGLPLARKNALVAFSNFAQAFYRMMGEPASQQRCVSEFNNLLIQSHIMAAQISTLITASSLPGTEVAPLVDSLKQIDAALENRALEQISQSLLNRSAETEPADWYFPLGQLQRAVQNIIRESMAIRAEPANA
ncbi:FUSC family protein [Orrella marina]|uniref:Uncharacterized protein n=1 Tax=Orrella marina TaxID=2163011 RepID=A0A2R4XK09_9BURK|nr:FUSC family membrane protein [Orrella marina]AWB34126.1 hypothetical protein DBV39_10850 [Orrella marina]